MIDDIKDAAHILRKEIRSCTFGLKKKHRDAFNLQTAWTNGKIKENVETFLAALFKLNRIVNDVDDLSKKEMYLDDMILDSDNDSDDTDDETTESSSCRTIAKSIHAYSIYQMMVYTVTNRKTKVSLHVMRGQSVYCRCCSRSTITSLNKIGVYIRYDDVRRGRALLALYAIKKGQDNLTPIPNPFRTGPGTGFVSGVFDNINIKDRSSTSGYYDRLLRSCCFSGC